MPSGGGGHPIVCYWREEHPGRTLRVLWESVDALYAYAFESDHRGPVQERRAWFTTMSRPHSVLWWVPRGTLPTVEEAEEPLRLLAEQGPTPEAFTFAQLFDPERNRVKRSKGMDQECGV